MSGEAANPFFEFLDRYEHNPTLFVQEVLGGDPDKKQRELMDAVARGERQIAVRSGHGVGKTTVLAWLVVWHICVKFPQKTVCTAPTSTQLFDALASEVKAWMGKLPSELQKLFEIKVEEIVLRSAPNESFISFRTSRPEVPEAMAGIHSANVLIIGDEASGIPEQVFEAGSGSMSGHNAVTILAGNPIRTSGTFFDAFHKLRAFWYTIHISCVDHPRVTPKYVLDAARKWGEESNAYRVRVLGEFPLADDNTVIPFELMESALKRDVKAINVRTVWGLDVARFGSDDSALCKRQGNVILEKVKSWNGLDTMALTGRIKAEWDITQLADRPEEICVDAIGLGAGVADRLRELGLPARAVNVSESPAMGDRYRNLRAELWWLGREWFTARDCNIGSDNDGLGGELVAVRYKFASNGKIQVESKEEMKKRGVKSPNLADAFILTFAAPAVSALHGTNNSISWKKPLRRVIKGIV